MLGKDWGLLGKCLICCKLSTYCRCCNIRRRSIRYVMPDIDSLWILFWCSLMMVVLPKTPSLKFRGGMMIMELHLLSWSKMVSQRKKLSDIWILTFTRFEILSYLIIWPNLVASSGSTSDKSRAMADNYQHINYLREQNANLIVIMIDWQTIRWWDYSHWKSPEIKKLGNVEQNLGNIWKTVSKGETISLGGTFVE